VAGSRRLPAHPALDESEWLHLLERWQQARRILIAGGSFAPDAALHAALRTLAAGPTAAVVGDISSNLMGPVSALHHWEAILTSRRPALQRELAPDLVVVFGGQITSKPLKLLLRAHPPRELWFVRPSGAAPDTYQALTHVIPLRPADFFRTLAQRATPAAGDYAARWAALQQQAAALIPPLLASQPFGEFAAVAAVLAALPAGGLLQVGNSMAVRYVNYLGAGNRSPARVDGNRGTSGIDGTVSTAVGAALASARLTTLIVGDLGFFYDRNGLWQPTLPPGLRIVLLNNHGGGIFGIIDGPTGLDPALQRDFFLTPQPLTARHTAADHGLRYYIARDAASLDAVLPAFFGDDGAALLEIESDLAVNSQVFHAFRDAVQGLQ
jgi:2-succinyl-5-enolpyruvyl-6-hydroxy-3-cyclohexene-1-carboxylate synthase